MQIIKLKTLDKSDFLINKYLDLLVISHAVCYDLLIPSENNMIIKLYTYGLHYLIQRVRAFSSSCAKFFVYFNIRTYFFLFYILTFQNTLHLIIKAYFFLFYIRTKNMTQYNRASKLNPNLYIVYR